MPKIITEDVLLIDVQIRDIAFQIYRRDKDRFIRIYTVRRDNKKVFTVRKKYSNAEVGIIESIILAIETDMDSGVII